MNSLKPHNGSAENPPDSCGADLAPHEWAFQVSLRIFFFQLGEHVDRGPEVALLDLTVAEYENLEKSECILVFLMGSGVRQREFGVAVLGNGQALAGFEKGLLHDVFDVIL
ncbi:MULTISPECIES: hypothetical protein [Variovorax]|uniref:hypothetical protein n=1 Tax=Variovorax TaxID=34072 RepID=UPI0021ABDCED|nr:hypothetical protein [Variovorax paradoxus]UVH58872.1 hypothetical protein NWF24_05550 [Variovorax paradoxus]